MSSSAITTQIAQLKVGNVQNQADSTSIYSSGQWSFKNSTAVTSVTITDAGNVGIGTTSPAVLNYGRELTVSNTSGAQPEAFLCLQGAKTVDQNVGAMVFFNSATPISSIATTRVGANNSGAITFSTANLGTIAERMRIDASGRLLVNATSSGTNEKLFVEGGIRTSGSGTPFVIVGGGNNLQFSMPASPNGAQILNSSGNPIDIVATSAGVRLVAGGTSWGAISDERKKKNIKPLEYGLAEVSAIKPVRFDYIVDESNASSRIGFTAQNLMPLVKESVQGAEDTEFTVTPVDLIPVLVKAIQELSAKVEEQSSRLEAQAEEIKALKAQP